MKTAPRSRRWYARSRTYFLTPEPERPRISRQARAHYGAIRRLAPEVGEDLDLRRAPQVVVRWIAWAQTDEDRGARYAAASAFHARTGRWPSTVEELRGLGKGAP